MERYPDVRTHVEQWLDEEHSVAALAVRNEERAMRGLEYAYFDLRREAEYVLREKKMHVLAHQLSLSKPLVHWNQQQVLSWALPGDGEVAEAGTLNTEEVLALLPPEFRASLSLASSTEVTAFDRVTSALGALFRGEDDDLGEARVHWAKRMVYVAVIACDRRFEWGDAPFEGELAEDRRSVWQFLDEERRSKLADRLEEALDILDPPKVTVGDPREEGLDDTACAVLGELKKARSRGEGVMGKHLRACCKGSIRMVEEAIRRLRKAGFTIDNPRNRSGYWLRD